MMDACAKVYINDEYSVELYKDEIKDIADSVREALYEMPRPADYSVADILTKVDNYASAHIETYIWMDTKTIYAFKDLCSQQRTKEDYWNVIKMVLEQIEVIAK